LDILCCVQILEVIRGLKFSNNDTWKPVQNGIQLSTSTIIDLHRTLVVSGDSKFLLTSRLNQDALENVFSQVRGKGDTHPSVVNFRYNLRAVCLSQFMSVPKTASYHADNTPHLLDLVAKNKPSAMVATATINDCNDAEMPTSDVIAIAATAIADIDYIDSNVIVYIAGWIVFKLKTLLKDCTDCCCSLVLQDGDDDPGRNLTTVKSRGGLSNPSRSIIELLLAAETVFRSEGRKVLDVANVEDYLMNLVEGRIPSSVELPPCHDVTHLAVRKYIRLRLHAHAAALSKRQASGQFASKSAAARTLVK
jgi:hypothetical protein